MNGYSPKEYWARLAESDPSADAAGFAPVLHPYAPAWFNGLVDELQFRALRRALLLANIAAGSRVLDLGCGTGRWVRRYTAMGFCPTGVDVTVGMLRLARERGTHAPLVGGDVFQLPFANASFDFVSDVTVVQHILPSFQPKAFDEMIRVLKPGGRLLLMEVIRGDDSAHVFPRQPRDWINEFTSRGAKLIGWFGQEFLLLDRMFVSLARHMARKNRRSIRDAASLATPKASVARHLFWEMRHVTAPLSAWTDPLIEGICPAWFATHGVFVFRI